MKHLYKLQTLLVLILLSVIPSWTFAQFSDPIHIKVRNSGTTYTDQFAAAAGYTNQILSESAPQLGYVNLVEGGGNTLQLNYTPEVGALGTSEIIIQYWSVSAPMHPLTKVYVFNIVNEIVTAGEDRYVVDAGASDVILDVLANDSVTNGDLTITTVSVSNDGSAIVTSQGDAIIYNPSSDFIGDTWIQYVTCDGAGNCAQGNVHVLVRDPNVQDDLTFSKYLLNTDHLDLLTPFEEFVISQAPQHGTLTQAGEYGWVYTPEAGYTGNDTFELGLLSQVSRTYNVAIYEKANNIHAKNDKFYVRPNLSITFNVLDNDLLEYEVSEYTNPNKGVLSEVSNGVYTYSPNTGFRGVDKFTYTTCYEDTVYCETATVLIHVTDLEPENVFSYSLQTSKDLPLAIDYPIEYTDFAYIISVEPQNGQLIYYAGLNQVNLPCDTIDAFNMLVYEPTPGYTGVDHFEYYYCIQPSNLCYLVKVDMDIVDHPETESCPCTVGCVWPGDADQDGRVDMNDLLTLGNRLGDVGPSRIYNDPATWFGQHAANWSDGGSTDTRFLDGNGDGVLTEADVNQISDYYYNTHDVVIRDVAQKLPYQFSILPVQFSLDSGDVVILDIALGNATYPVIDLKGAKFSINLPAAMVDSSSVEVDFHRDSWLAEGSPFISLGKIPWDGRIDAGFARARGKGGSGFGVIATVVFIIEDDIEGFKTNNGIIKIPITLQAGSAMDNNGTIYDIEGDEFVLTYDLNANNRKEYNLIVYPNPAQDVVDIHLNGKTEIQSIEIIDPSGRMITQVEDVHDKHHQLNVSSLPVGLYYVKVNHTHGVVSQLLSVIK